MVRFDLVRVVVARYSRSGSEFASAGTRRRGLAGGPLI